MGKRDVTFAVKLDGSGFEKGLKKLEADARASGKKQGKAMGGALAAEVEKAVAGGKATAKAAEEAVKKIGASPDAGLAAIKKIESAGMSTADRLKRAFSAAYASASEPWRGSEGRVGALSKKGHGETHDARRSVGSMAGGAVLAGGAVMGAAALAVAYKSAEEIKELGGAHIGLEEKTHQIAASGRAHGEGYLDEGKLIKEFYGVTQKVKGTGADEAAEATAAFLALTGDLNTARGSLEMFATVARATGGNMTDVSKSAAAISSQFKITNADELKDVFATLSAQGKAGAIELGDLATGLQSLAAAGAAAGLRGSAGVKTLGGLTQIARTGSGSSDEAFTAVRDFFTQLAEKAPHLAAQGVKVYEGKGASKHQRAPEDIIVESISKLGHGDIAKRNELLEKNFGVQGSRLLKPLTTTYDNAYQGATGKDGKAATTADRTAAGVAALREQLDKAIHVAGSWTDVVQDAAHMSETNTAKQTAAMEALKQKVGMEVVPAFNAFLDKVTTSPEILAGLFTGIELAGKGLTGMVTTLQDMGLITKDDPLDKFRTDLVNKNSEERAAREAGEKVHGKEWDMVHGGVNDLPDYAKNPGDDPSDVKKRPLFGPDQEPLWSRAAREASESLGKPNPAAGPLPGLGGAPLAAGATGSPGAPPPPVRVKFPQVQHVHIDNLPKGTPRPGTGHFP